MNIRSRVREMVHGVQKTHNEKIRNNIRYQKNSPRTAKNHTTIVTGDIVLSVGRDTDWETVSIFKGCP